MAEHEGSNGVVVEQSQAMAHQLVWLASQLQKWSSAQTPLDNDYQISFTQVSALYAIRYGADTPGVIANRLRITPRAVTSHIDVLEAKGLLKRSTDLHDRRRQILTLTDEGTALSIEIEATALTTFGQYIHNLGPEEHEAMQKAIWVLNRFIQSVANPRNSLPTQ